MTFAEIRKRLFPPVTFAEIRARVPGLLVEDWGDNVPLSPPPPEDWMPELIELPPPRYDVKSTEDWDEELNLIEDWSSGLSEPAFSLTTGVCKPKWRKWCIACMGRCGDR
ncbi:hypothetical protein ACF0H5_012108 [Mactra antiquata]